MLIYFPEKMDIDYYMNFNNCNIKQVAKKCGVSEEVIWKVIKGEDITLEEARKIKKALCLGFKELIYFD